jgi:hypothetical protein
MRARLHSKFIAALLAPALIASGAQATLLRCGPEVRKSCCCPAGHAPPPSRTLAPAAPQCCSMSAPSTPARPRHDPASIATAPAPVSMLATVTADVTPLDALFDRVRQVPRLDRPPGLSPVLANCTLLI